MKLVIKKTLFRILQDYFRFKYEYTYDLLLIPLALISYHLNTTTIDLSITETTRKEIIESKIDNGGEGGSNFFLLSIETFSILLSLMFNIAVWKNFGQQT